MVETAREVIAVTDASKFGKVCLHRIIDVAELDALITDTAAPHHIDEAAERLGGQALQGLTRSAAQGRVPPGDHQGQVAAQGFRPATISTMRTPLMSAASGRGASPKPMAGLSASSLPSP